VLICQPMFRAYCKECGPNLRTGDFIHFIQGIGDIIVGRDVWLDGKSTFTFAASFVDRPSLVIGDGTGIGHGCEITVGKRITIGRNCILSGDVSLFDSNGHPSDPTERRNKRPPAAEDVRPITIGDDVWIGKHVIVFPGVRIGEGAIISSGTVVRRHVPAYGVVAGNPAQLMFRLKKPVTDVAEKADIAERALRAV
jgi:acetyltransferase-like isoleucine patch superfamily enzyme